MNTTCEWLSTEIERFDQLVFGTSIYDKWCYTLKNRKFFFVERVIMKISSKVLGVVRHFTIITKSCGGNFKC